MGDEQYYLIVEEELKDGKIDKALWAKASALGKADDLEARLQYIKSRVEALKGEAAGKQKIENVKKIKAQTKKYSIIAGKIVGGLVAVSIIIVVCILSYQRYQSYLDEKLRYELICSNENNEAIYRSIIPRRNIKEGLTQVNRIKRIGDEFIPMSYDRYEWEVNEGESGSGYFAYVEDKTHLFKNTDYVNRAVCTGSMEYKPFDPNPRKCTREEDDNDMITTLDFFETKEDTYRLTETFYLRGIPTAAVVTEYSCRFNIE